METVERLTIDCADGAALAVGGPCADASRLYGAYQAGRGTARVLKHAVR